MSRTLSLLLVSLMVLSPLQAAWAESLPIQKILLYKHGVAYFERSGPVAGQAEITLEFKASEMNDVLKRLNSCHARFGRGISDGAPHALLEGDHRCSCRAQARSCAR